MKFKFCSEGDCPLWALAALHAVGSVPAPVFRQLVDHVTEDAGWGSGDEDKVMEILKDTNLNSRMESARAAAVIRWACASAWRSSCGGAALARDLLVLGASRHHAHALAEAVDRHRTTYEKRADEEKFIVNRVTDVTASPGAEPTVNVIQLSLHTDDAFTRQQSETHMLIDRDHARAMLADMKRAYEKMEQIRFE